MTVCSSPSSLCSHLEAHGYQTPVDETTFLSGEDRSRTAWQWRGGALRAPSSKASLGTPEILVGVRSVFNITTSSFFPSQSEQIANQGHAGQQGLTVSSGDASGVW